MYDPFQTCFLVPGLNRGECASWVQALGSIAAIGAAVWLGRRTERRARSGALNQFVLFKASVRDALTGTIKCAASRDMVGVRYGQAMVQESLLLGRTVQLHMLDEIDALTANRVSGVISRAASVIESTLVQPAAPLHLAFLEAELKSLTERLDQIEGVTAA